MTTPFHALEIFLCALFNLLPYAALAVLVFRDLLRFGPHGTTALVAALCAVQVFLGFCAAVLFRRQVVAVSLLGDLVYIAFFFAAIRASAGQMVFLLFLETNYASFVLTAAKFLEGLLFPSLAGESYRWSLALSMLMVQAATLPVVGIFCYREIRPALTIPETRSLWRYLWIIPLIFYLTWFYVIYFASGRSAAETASRPATAAFLLLVNIGALIVYRAVAAMVQESAHRQRLEADNHALALCNLQLARMEEQMDETRRARHDLRQHFGALLGYADAGDYEGLREYLEQFRAGRMAESTPRYCENNAVNAVAAFYLQRAQQAGASVTTRLELPNALPVPDADLAVLFGNLLENAAEAIERQQDGERFLRMTTSARGSLVLTLDNSFGGEVQEKDGVFLSSKRKNAGFGTVSVRAIAEKYGGVAKLECGNGVFRASVLLPL